MGVQIITLGPEPGKVTRYSHTTRKVFEKKLLLIRAEFLDQGEEGKGNINPNSVS